MPFPGPKNPIESIVERILMEKHTCLIGRVLSYKEDGDEGFPTCTVENAFYKKEKSKEPEALPPIEDIPYCQIQGIELPEHMIIGSSVVVLCIERAIHEWLESGKQVYQNETRYMSLLDAVASPFGPIAKGKHKRKSDKNSMAIYNGDSIVELTSDNRVIIKGSELSLEESGTITITKTGLIQKLKNFALEISKGQVPSSGGPLNNATTIAQFDFGDKL